MVKKIILGTLAVGLVAILVVGAVNRTNSKALAADGQAGQHGQSQTTLAGASVQPLERGGNGGRGGGNGWDRQGESDETSGLRGAPAGRDDRRTLDGATGVGQAEVVEMVILAGVVTAADDAGLVVRADSGQVIEISRRGWTYAQSQGFAPAAGDAVTLTGFYEADRFEAAVIADETNGQEIALRDENGRPMWAGRGGGRSRG